MLINRMGNKMKKKSNILDRQRSRRSRRAMSSARSQVIVSAILHSTHWGSHGDAFVCRVTQFVACEFQEDFEQAAVLYLSFNACGVSMAMILPWSMMQTGRRVRPPLPLCALSGRWCDHAVLVL